MPGWTRPLAVSLLLVGLAAAPAAEAQHYRGYDGRYHHHHNDVGAAILGGIIGLGLGAAIAGAAQPPAYYAPPPAYYPPPAAYPPAYYAPPPAYYGYDEPPY